MFRAEFLLEEYRRFEPDSSAAVIEAVKSAGSDLGFVTLEPQAFARTSAKSIDYAVMERTTQAAVIPVSYGWSDVGSWQSVWELSARDAANNAANGQAVFIDTRNSFVSSGQQIVAMFGVENLVVVASDDAILVARRDDGDGLRRVVRALKDKQLSVTEEHRKVHRPWGSYQSVDQGNRFQVKRIIVKPGGRLSLQLHHHRAEHWIVVRGTARVTIGDDVTIVHENEFDLRSHRFPASSGKSRQDRARVDRSADRQLPRRGRYRADRGRLSPVVGGRVPAQHAILIAERESRWL